MYAEVDIIEYAVWCGRQSGKGITANMDDFLKEVGTSNIITSLENYRYNPSKMYIKIKKGSCFKFKTQSYDIESFIETFNELTKID